MPQLATFIGESHRPEINGGRLDKNHISRFLLNYVELDLLKNMDVKTIVFGPKKDKVLLNLEYAINNSEPILILYYEDIHKRWSYVQTNKECYFLYKKNENEQYKVLPRCLYIRGCQIDPGDSYWLIIGEFYNFVDTWDGKVVCSPSAQNNNESKLYQLTHSLTACSKNYKNISIGTSYVVKGETVFDQLVKNKSYIVKSLSSIRSIVVDDSEFNRWNQESLNNLPVLFQEKAEGNDLRVHVVNGKVYGKYSTEKSQVDYRYDNKFWSLKEFNNFSTELKTFCLDVAAYEKNPLIGIDFIKNGDSYVVLEANPSPGWSAYHECNGVENDPFVDDLLLEFNNV